MSLPYRPLAEIWPLVAQELISPPIGIRLDAWPAFTEILGGLRPNELTLLCAPTGAGKTQFLCNISAQLLSMGVPHFAAPVETGDTDFLIRVVSALEGYDFNTGDPVSMQAVERVTTKYLALMQSGNLLISTHDNRVDVAEMINLLKYMNDRYRVKVAILDNLNFFLKVTSTQMERAEMDSAIHEFVMLAKKIPMHVILVCHPKKTDGGRVLSEFDIKGSSTAVQEASNVVLFNRADPKDVDTGKRRHTDRELVFRKIRKRGVNVGVPIWFRFKSGRYEEESE